MTERQTSTSPSAPNVGATDEERLARSFRRWARAAAASTTFAFVAVGAIGALSWIGLQDASSASSELAGTQGEMRRLDEVLTMSARLYAETGDEKWKARYDHHLEQLERAIASARESSVRLLGEDLARSADDANRALVAMESACFEHVAQHRREDAIRLLQSEQYHRWKAEYAAGMDALWQALAGSIDRRLRTRLTAMFIAGAVGVIGLLVSLFGWRFVHRQHRIHRSLRDLGSAAVPARPWGSAALAIVVTAIGLGLTGLAVHSTAERIAASARAEFDALADQVIIESRRRVDLAHYVLNSIRGLFASSRIVERAEFRTFLAQHDLAQGYLGLRRLGFIERVTRDNLDTFTSNARADGAPDFVVRSAGDRADLFVTKFVEPAERAAGALGVDMGDVPARRAAIERAVHTGETTITGDVSLSEDGLAREEFLYLVPIYRPGSDLNTHEARWAALEGVVFASVNIRELFAGLNEAAGGMLEIDVFAGRRLTREARVLDSGASETAVDGNDLAAAYKQRMFHALRQIRSGEVAWTIAVTPTPKFEATVDRAAAFGHGVSGGLLSVVLGILVWTMRTSRSRALALAETMTSDLTEAKNRSETANRILREEIAARRAIELHMRHVALHDPLTGLPNRSLLSDRLQQCIVRARRQPENGYAVLFIDLDNFKYVNDSLGHDAGDELLVETSLRIARVLRASDTVSRADHGAAGPLAARFGGDEFVVVLERLRGPEDAVRVVERIQAELAAPYRLGTHEISIQCSIGVVTGSPRYAQCEALLRDADTAMYRAKSAGKARYALFDESMHVATRERLGLENDLRRAVESGEIHAVYQPIVSLESGRVVSFEALARWSHPQRGAVSPLDFIRVAEETGMIVPLGRLVLEQACALLARLRRLPGGDRICVNVNVSRRQLVEPTFVSEVAALLRGMSVPPDRLCLEITESTAMSAPGAIERSLKQFNALGVGLQLDDFGTGLSSLGLLRTLPLDGIKIDRSFIDAADGVHEAIAILHAITSLGHNLRKTVTAEGISEREQVATILALDCDRVQGYLFGRPASADDAAAMLMVDFSALCGSRAARGAAYRQVPDHEPVASGAPES